MPNEAAQQKRTSMHLNFVHTDQIWKDHVRHESTSQLRKWPERWGYLVAEYSNMARYLEGKSPQPMSPTIDTQLQSNTLGDIKLPAIKPLKHTRNKLFPMTTAREIGWRCVASQGDHLGSRWAPRARGKAGILKQLKWPAEAAP